ncbi:Protein of unknown function [Gryllus bimaculatus]|nr:Protein of unknown function [Gryllus bimaculatus]
MLVYRQRVTECVLRVTGVRHPERGAGGGPVPGDSRDGRGARVPGACRLQQRYHRVVRAAHQPAGARACASARDVIPTLLFLLVNGCLLVAAGGVLLADWCRMYYRIYNLQPKLYLDMMIASGIIAIFNAAAHFVDVGLTVALS